MGLLRSAACLLALWAGAASGFIESYEFGMYPGSSLDEEEEKAFGRPPQIQGSGAVDAVDIENPTMKAELHPVPLYGKKHIVHTISAMVQYKRIPEFLRHGVVWVPGHYYGDNQGLRLVCPVGVPRNCVFYVAVRDCAICEKHNTKEYWGTGGLPEILPSLGFKKVTKCNSLVTASIEVGGDQPTELWRGEVEPGQEQRVMFTYHAYHFGVFTTTEHDCAAFNGHQEQCLKKPFCTYLSDSRCVYNENFCEGDPFYAKPKEDIFPVFPPNMGWRGPKEDE